MRGRTERIAMIDPIWIFAVVLMAAGAVGGFVGFLQYISRKYRRSIRHRLFDRIPPSRWPQVDYRVGKVCRPRDFE